MPVAHKRVQDVAAVELPDRQQVQGRGEHTHPRGSGHRVQGNVGGCRAGEEEVLKNPE